MATIAAFLLSSAFSLHALAQAKEGAPAESPEVADSFSRLDQLAAEIADRLRAIALSGPLPAPPTLPPTPLAGPFSPGGRTSPASSTDSAQRPQDVPSPSPPGGSQAAAPACGSRSDMDFTMDALDESYGEFSETIIAANTALPAFSAAVVSLRRAGCESTANDVTSTISKLEKLDVEAASGAADGLVSCVEDRRRKAQEDLDLAGKQGKRRRQQRLMGEIGDLTVITKRLQDMQKSFWIAASKRTRLLEELAELDEEILYTCE